MVADEEEYIGENDEDGLRDELAEENDLEEEGEEGRLVESSLVDMREQGEEEEGEGGDYCRPSLARNLYWQQTPRGQPHVQPCPNGATGSARWLCSHHQVGKKIYYERGLKFLRFLDFVIKTSPQPTYVKREGPTVYYQHVLLRSGNIVVSCTVPGTPLLH
jgi:hypothetical protein